MSSLAVAPLVSVRRHDYTHSISRADDQLSPETAGEIKDVYPNTKVTLVHSDSQLLSGIYPDKFRRLIEQKVRSRDINLVFEDYIDEFPEPGQTVDITTRRGKTIKGADLVVSSSSCMLELGQRL